MKDIKVICKEHGKTMKEVSQAIGMTSNNLGTLMRRNPTLSLLRQVADALGITVSELVKD